MLTLCPYSLFVCALFINSVVSMGVVVGVARILQVRGGGSQKLHPGIFQKIAEPGSLGTEVPHWVEGKAPVGV